VVRGRITTDLWPFHPQRIVAHGRFTSGGTGDARGNDESASGCASDRR
jgi:hypothetical protein